MTKHVWTWALIAALTVSAGAIVTAQSAADKAESIKKQQQEGEAAAKRQREETRQEQEQNIARLKAQYPLTPLSVEVVVSRYQGEKRVSSLPYTLSINANSLRWGGKVSQLRMGGQIPIQVGPSQPSVEGKPVVGIPGSYSYKEIGTNIDASASSIEEGRYQLNITIEDSSVYPGDQALPGTPRVNGMPVFRSFRSSNELILRDGQSTQFTAATDRVSGEIVKIDVKLTVVK